MKVFFLAIPKTGSTSIHKSIVDSFSSPYSRDQLKNLNKTIHEYMISKYKVPLDVDYIEDHWPFGAEKLFSGKFFRFTFIRNPINRTISSIQHCLDRHPCKSPALNKVRHESASTIANYCLNNNLFCNAMVHQLGGVDDLHNILLRNKQKTHGNFYFPYLHCRKKAELCDLELAKSNIASLDFVGTYENISSDFSKLTDLLGLKCCLTSKIYKKTKSSCLWEAEDIIKKMNNLDLQLYNNVTGIVH